jgi:photosystem II stability/assembly factor-like uncharacterized protein
MDLFKKPIQAVKAKSSTRLVAVLLILLFSLWNFLEGEAKSFSQTDNPPIPTPVITYLPLVTKNSIPGQGLVPIGPFGGTFTAVASDPSNPEIAYAGSYGNGVLRTMNGGLHWSYVNNGLGNWTIQSLAVNPVNPGTIYAGTYKSGIYRSDDYGMNWRASNGTELWNKIVYDIEIDPRNPSIIFASTRISGSIRGYLYKSTNGGETWSLVHSLPADYAYDVDIAPWDSNTILVAYHNRSGYFISTNGGASFRTRNGALTEPEPWQIAMDPVYPGLVYGGHKEERFPERSAYVSYNSGNDWQASPIGLPVRALALASLNNQQSRVIAGTFENGIYISNNRGGSWLHKGLPGKWINSIAVAEGNPQTWYAAEQYHGVFFSKDYGNSWRGSETLLRNTVISGLKTWNGKLVAAVFGQGVMQSTDSGDSWEALGNGLGDPYLLGLDEIEGKLHALTLRGIYQFDGQTWKMLTTGPDTLNREEGQARTSAVYHVPVESIQFVSDFILGSGLRGNSTGTLALRKVVMAEGKLYVASLADGLWAFERGEWKRVLGQGEEVTYLGLFANGSDLQVGTCSETTCRLYLLRDGNYTEWDSGLDGARVNAIAEGFESSFVATSAGLYSRKLGSPGWTPAGLNGVILHSIAIDPENRCKIVTGGEGAIYLSDDCAETWKMVQADNPFVKFDELLIIPDSLIVGSKGAGIFEYDTNLKP